LFTSPLYQAASQGNKEILEILLSSSFLWSDIEYRSHERKVWTIKGAIDSYHPEIIDFALDPPWNLIPVSITSRSSHFNELRAGLWSGDIDLFLHLKKIVEDRVPKFESTADRHFQDIFCWSLVGGRLQIVRYLLDLGANVNGGSLKYELFANPLRKAAEAGQLELVELSLNGVLIPTMGSVTL